MNNFLNFGIIVGVGLFAATAQATSIEVSLHGSRVIKIRQSAMQLSVADGDIAEVKLISPNQILVNGRKLGQTLITVWDKNGKPQNHVLQVTVPVEGLAEKLEAIFPGEQIYIEAVGKTLVLNGRVSDPSVVERAKQVVDAHLQSTAPGSQVLNFLGVRGRQQVQLRAKIAEVSRSALRKLGVNVWYRDADVSGGLLAPAVPVASAAAATPLNLTTPAAVAGAAAPVAALPHLSAPFSTDSFGVFFASQSSIFPLSAAVSLLQGQGLAKILSEPTLVTYSGQPAEFLAGGEFPVPIPTGLGQVSIEYKKYGVSLNFTPVVMANHYIHLKVAVAVSDRDNANTVSVLGTAVPALTTRRSETTVRLKTGQSVAIAGLLQDRIETNINKVPLLGELPLLGMLFRSKSFSRRETELVILVRAELVKPLNPGEVPPLPGEDEIADAGAWAFFLLGSGDPQIRNKSASKAVAAGPHGFSQ